MPNKYLTGQSNFLSQVQMAIFQNEWVKRGSSSYGHMVYLFAINVSIGSYELKQNISERGNC